jgi:hypothetical protein
MRRSTWPADANDGTRRQAHVRQSLDSVNAIRECDEINDLMIRNLVAALAIKTKPIQGSAEFPVIKAHQPAISDGRKRGRTAKIPCAGNKAGANGVRFAAFSLKPRRWFAGFVEDFPFVETVIRSVQPHHPVALV